MPEIRGLDPDTRDHLTVRFDRYVQQVARRPATSVERDSLHVISRGLIDLQVNGYSGVDFNDIDHLTSEQLELATSRLANEGVTSIVPTLVTGTFVDTVNKLNLLRLALDSSQFLRDCIPFIHLEGPFISSAPGARGVHDPRHIRPPNVEDVHRWNCAGQIGMITMSPHWPGSEAAVAVMAQMGIRVAIGHTDASHEQIVRSIDAGATFSTHLGNGISEQIARHPNPIWTQLGDSRLTCGLIADGHHLPAETLRSMAYAKGRGRYFIVSDATALAGKPPGEYRTQVGGRVRLDREYRLTSLESGTLAGSASSVARGVQYAVDVAGLALSDALAATTATPARIAGLNVDLAPGALADIIMVDQRGAIRGVWKAGQQLRRR